jgi:formylglycine-generating enzyme required for sulfatase activity
VSQIDTPIPTRSVTLQMTTIPAPTATAQPLATQTPQPSDTPLRSPTPLSSPAPEQIAFTPVPSNAAWTHVEREFDQVVMVLVPVGCFMMGSENGEADEKPVREQCFDRPFWIDKYEVSNAQFEAFDGVANNDSNRRGENLPREKITWLQAQAFCAKRGARLPTEREWEYAARGPDALEYPWGEKWNTNNAVWGDNSNSLTVDVKSHSEGGSWVGALHMIGNVWEWTSSPYQDYPYNTNNELDDTTDDEIDSQRVLRGGSWANRDNNLRSANRFNDDPGNVSDGYGFRCARSWE